jgi:hypothetical protein
VERLGEVGDRHVDVLDASAPAGVDEARERGERGEDGHRERAVVAEARERRSAEEECDVAASVRTKSEENEPIANRLAQARRSASGWRFVRRAYRPSGMAIAEPTSQSAVAAAGSAPNGMSGSRRQPM